MQMIQLFAVCTYILLTLYYFLYNVCELIANITTELQFGEH